MIMYVFMTLLYIAQIVSSNKQEFLQLDGAFKASALGGTVIGCQSKNASILVTYSSNCIENRSNNPIKMSYAFGIAITGLAADATYITNKIFDDYSEYKFIYDAHIPIQRLAANIAQMKHKRTLSLAQRPYGIRTVIIGYDDHLLHQLYEIDPIGSLHKCKLCLVGPYCKELNSEWGNTQDPSNLSTEEAIRYLNHHHYILHFSSIYTCIYLFYPFIHYLCLYVCTHCFPLLICAFLDHIHLFFIYL